MQKVIWIENKRPEWALAALKRRTGLTWTSLPVSLVTQDCRSKVLSAGQRH